MKDDDLFAEDGTDLSREFLKHRERGRDPFCARPWHTLKIHMDTKTRVCCDFFTWLPAFEFPTAKAFHSEEGMWNHPFMQRMRATMGLPGEVPFCTLCLTADKRDPAHADRRKKAGIDSRRLFQELEDQRRQQQLRGNLSAAPEDLSGVTVHGRTDEPFTPFRTSKSGYRRKIATYGFFPCKRVLLLGCATPGWAPFLAEACETFVAADSHAERLRRAVDACAFYGIEAVEHRLNPGTLLTAFEDESFDGIWVDGRQLFAARHAIPLAELRRILSPDGALRCHSAPGPGRLLQALAKAPNAKRVDEILTQLRAGPDRQQMPRFLTHKTVRHVLRDGGLAFDISKTSYGAKDTVEKILGMYRLEPADRAKFEEHYADAQGLLDITLSFSAMRRESR